MNDQSIKMLASRICNTFLPNVPLHIRNVGFDLMCNIIRDFLNDVGLYEPQHGE